LELRRSDLDYLLHILILIGIYAILAMSLDLLVGHTGLLSVAHAAFYGLGAYSAALLSVHFGIPFVLSVILGMLTAILASLIFSLPSLRLHDDYFVIATFAFQMILFGIFNNWTGMTRGPFGIPGIPPPSILGLPIRSRIAFVFLVVVFAVLCFQIVSRISMSPFGRVLRGIREDETFTRALGKNTVRFKVLIFAVSAALAASAGCLYAQYLSFIAPTSFTVMESILVISMVVIGGAGSRWGPIVGAIVLVTLPEALRFVGLPNDVAANLRQIAYGGGLVTMMMFRPQGLIGKYGFGR